LIELSRNRRNRSEPGILEKSKEEYLNLRQPADEYGQLVVNEFEIQPSMPDKSNNIPSSITQNSAVKTPRSSSEMLKKKFKEIINSVSSSKRSPKNKNSILSDQKDI
jgi:hypothetical protein